MVASPAGMLTAVGSEIQPPFGLRQLVVTVMFGTACTTGRFGTIRRLTNRTFIAGRIDRNSPGKFKNRSIKPTESAFVREFDAPHTKDLPCDSYALASRFTPRRF